MKLAELQRGYLAPYYLCRVDDEGTEEEYFEEEDESEDFEEAEDFEEGGEDDGSGGEDATADDSDADDTEEGVDSAKHGKKRTSRKPQEEGAEGAEVEGNEDGEVSETGQGDKREAEGSGDAAAKERHTIKINGEEREVTLAELKKGYALAKASTERFEKAAALRKDAEKVLAALEKRPLDVMRDLGVDVDKLVVEAAYELYNLQQMTEEQRELHELRKEREKWARTEETRKEREAREAHEREMQAHLDALSDTVTEALQHLTVLPANADSAALIADMVATAEEAGYEVPSAAELAVLVEEQEKDRIARLVKSAASDPERLQQLLGEETAGALRKRAVAKAKARRPAKAEARVRKSSRRRTTFKDLESFWDDKEMQYPEEALLRGTDE